MVNQFSFDLDDGYLQHDKFGAYYSKNWDKKNRMTIMPGITRHIKRSGTA